jgi:hypothetical protein
LGHTTDKFPVALLPFTCAPVIEALSVVAPLGVGRVNVKSAVRALLDVDQAPFPTVTDMKWLMTSGTPTVKVSFNPELAKLSLLTDSVRLTVDANVTVDAWAEVANDTAAPPIASAANNPDLINFLTRPEGPFVVPQPRFN